MKKSEDPPIISELTLEAFDFALPADLVAHEPLAHREDSKLLIYNAPQTYQMDRISNLDHILPKGSVLILNNSKVFPSRLMGTLPTGGKIEVFLCSEHQASPHRSHWRALAKPLKKLHPGLEITFHGPPQNKNVFQPPLIAKVLEKNLDEAILEFNINSKSLHDWLDDWGIIPLPPYIKRSDLKPARYSPDRDRYQTVFAEVRGSVAAPTAGLHFSDELLQRLSDNGVMIKFISLHVGAGTFLPVKSQAIHNHRMHSEPYCAPKDTIEEIIKAKAENRPVIAVGTTSFRCLEDLFRKADNDPEKMLHLSNQWHETDLFIYPKNASDIYRPWVIDGIFTNFHQPQSTLIMLISSLIGLPNLMDFYKVAIENKFRLFSYGDTSLIWLKRPTN